MANRPITRAVVLDWLRALPLKPRPAKRTLPTQMLSICSSRLCFPKIYGLQLSRGSLHVSFFSYTIMLAKSTSQNLVLCKNLDDKLNWLTGLDFQQKKTRKSPQLFYTQPNSGAVHQLFSCSTMSCRMNTSMTIYIYIYIYIYWPLLPMPR